MCDSCSYGYWNTEGNKCETCNVACDGCESVGIDACILCSDGFFRQNGNCIPCDPRCDTC